MADGPSPAVKAVLLVIVVCIALVMSLYPIVHSPEQIRYGLGPFQDSRLYHDLAYNLTQGHGYSGVDVGEAVGLPHPDSLPAYEPAVTRGPIYPFFLFTVYKVFGDQNARSRDTWHVNWDRVRIVQGVLTALLSLLVFFIVQVIWEGSFWPALSAALIQACCFYNIFYAKALLAESVVTFLMTGFILCGVLALKTKKTGWWLAAGALFGLVVLGRGEYLPFLGLFSAYIVWVNRRQIRLGVRQAIFFAGAALCMIAPWTIRNYDTFNQFIPVSVGGVGSGLYTGTFESQKNWKGWQKIPDEVFYLPHEKERFLQLLDAFNHYYTMGTIEVQGIDLELKQMAIDRIKSRPVECVTNWFAKVPRLWFQDYIQWYAVKEASGGWFIFYFMCAVAAFVFSLKMERAMMGLIGLLFVYLTLVFLPLHVEPRYSVVLMPGIIALAGIGLGRTFNWAKAKFRSANPIT